MYVFSEVIITANIYILFYLENDDILPKIISFHFYDNEAKKSFIVLDTPLSLECIKSKCMSFRF